MCMNVQKCASAMNRHSSSLHQVFKEIFSKEKKTLFFRPVSTAPLASLRDPPESEPTAIELSPPELLPAVHARQPPRWFLKLLFTRELGKGKLRIPWLMNPDVVPQEISNKIRETTALTLRDRLRLFKDNPVLLGNVDLKLPGIPLCPTIIRGSR